MSTPDQKQQGDDKEQEQPAAPAPAPKVRFFGGGIGLFERRRGGHNRIISTMYAPTIIPSTRQPHGFRSVPRALLVERAQKDKAKAHKLGDKVMQSMDAAAAGSGGDGGGGGGGSPDPGPAGPPRGRSALQR